MLPMQPATTLTIKLAAASRTEAVVQLCRSDEQSDCGELEHAVGKNFTGSWLVPSGLNIQYPAGLLNPCPRAYLFFFLLSPAVAAQCTLEALKMVTMASTGLNNYMM